MNDVRPIAPDAVRWIAKTLEDAGFETWAVGGAIRDALLGSPSDDWDMATRATPAQMRRIFRRTVPIGVEHGTVGVLARDGVMYEVTTFRRDVETDGRHAVVEFADSIEDDLSRRDFTINAVAWHPLREVFLDPFSGVEDLQNGVLRTVGAAEDRFREDYLRILRAIRFAGRFELQIEQATWTAVCALVEYLTTLSPERVRDELLKVLSADRRPSGAIRMYVGSGAAAVLYPEWSLVDQEEWDRSLGTLDHLPAGRPHLRLAALLRPIPGDKAAALLMRLRLSNAVVQQVAHVAEAPSLPGPEAEPELFRRWLSTTGIEALRAVVRLDLAAARHGSTIEPGEVIASWRRARDILAEKPALTVTDLALDGRGLIGLGLKPGPAFGDILDELLDSVLEDPALNHRATLEDRALAIAARRTVEDPAPREGGRAAGAPDE